LEDSVKKILSLLSGIILFAQTGWAQQGFLGDEFTTIESDTGFIPDQALVDSLNPQKSLLIPIGEAIGLNLGLGAFNTAMGSEFAKISFKTMQHNFETGWFTDADGLITNMWAHPFHGSIYFNLARSSGFNYWTSMGVAATGSFQWEFFMENEPPALNDWIMTSIGGSMLGEMFYRFSNLILDESLDGWPRFFNELGAGIFNPGRLFNRLIYGRTARVTTAKLYETQRNTGWATLGMNNVAEGTSFKDGKKNLMFTLEYTYGRLFYKKTLKPFDFFRFYTAINFGKRTESKDAEGNIVYSGQPAIGQFRVYGILAGKSSNVGENGKFLLGLFQHFDYLENNVYQIGGTSIGPGVGFRTSPKEEIKFAGTLHAALLLMGAANSDYAAKYNVEFLGDTARTYNMGPGMHAKLDAALSWSWGLFQLGYGFWWIHTWDGAPGDEFIGMWTPRLRIFPFSNWSIGLEYLLYHRRGIYQDLEDRDYRNNEQRLSIGYHF